MSDIFATFWHIHAHEGSYRAMAYLREVIADPRTGPAFIQSHQFVDLITHPAVHTQILQRAGLKEYVAEQGAERRRADRWRDGVVRFG